MEKFKNKGLEVQTHKDGTKTYIPFAVYEILDASPSQKTYYIDCDWMINHPIYRLSNRYPRWHTKDKIKAEQILNNAIIQLNKQLETIENSKIIKTEKIYL